MKVLVALSGGHLVYLEVDLVPNPMAVDSDDSDDLVLVDPPSVHPRATFRSDLRVKFGCYKFKEVLDTRFPLFNLRAPNFMTRTHAPIR